MSLLQKYRIPIVVILVTLLSISSSIFIYYIVSRTPADEDSQDQYEEIVEEDQTEMNLSPAIEAGMSLCGGNCEGEGPVEIIHSPMSEEDFAFIIPYGMVVGSHVTPIDHQYFSPTIFNSPRDTYEVRAVADGTITEIQSREDVPHADSDMSESGQEYRIVFSHTCTFFTYFDLVTSLTPEIEAEFEANRNGTYAGNLGIDVKAGDLIGYIGGQTLDFAVWDTEKPLTGFVVPEHYDTEPWKLYTADPYDYYSSELTDMMTEKNIRTAEPIAGKIDYDIDGKLIGNWFMEGTNGYAGSGDGPYYAGHLAIIPHHIDPTAIVVSIGDFEGDAKQFTIPSDAPDPTEVGVASGIVKYDLMDWLHVLPDGSNWDGISFARGISFQPAVQSNGCMLVQLIEDRSLKTELFPGISCDAIAGFGSNFRMYER